MAPDQQRVVTALDTAAQALAHPDPIFELSIGTLCLVAIIIFHGASLRAITRRFSAAWVHVTARTPHWKVNLKLAVVIGALTVVHLFETLLWAAPLHASGVIPDLRDSYYYVLESYTTLGEGQVILPDKWRLLGPMIAMSGLFTFGWTGSVLVSIMNDFSRLDTLRAEIAAKAADPAEGAEPKP